MIETQHPCTECGNDYAEGYCPHKTGIPTAEFHELVIELCRRYTHVKHAIRMQALVVAALAMIDAASVEQREGVCATEAEFLEMCRRFFRKARGIPQ